MLFVVAFASSLSASSMGEGIGNSIGGVQGISPGGIGGGGGPSFSGKAGAIGPPTVTAVSPSSGTTAGGTPVVITGTNFNGATVVDFGLNPASFSLINANTIDATSPAGSAGTINVTVTTPQGTSATSAADQFTYSTCSNSLDFSQACNSQYAPAMFN